MTQPTNTAPTGNIWLDWQQFVLNQTMTNFRRMQCLPAVLQQSQNVTKGARLPKSSMRKTALSFCVMSATSPRHTKRRWWSSSP